jgi:hypothetical protein
VGWLSDVMSFVRWSRWTLFGIGQYRTAVPALWRLVEAKEA